jgi:hypothetical protein
MPKPRIDDVLNVKLADGNIIKAKLVFICDPSLYCCVDQANHLLLVEENWNPSLNVHARLLLEIQIGTPLHSLVRALLARDVIAARVLDQATLQQEIQRLDQQVALRKDAVRRELEELRAVREEKKQLLADCQRLEKKLKLAEQFAALIHELPIFLGK